MPTRCIVAGCSNTPSEGVSLHRFPKDETLRKSWATKVWLTRAKWFGPSPTMLQPCSNHAPTMLQPCSNHAPTMLQPCSNHAPTMLQPCSNHAPTMLQPCSNPATEDFKTSLHGENKEPCESFKRQAKATKRCFVKMWEQEDRSDMSDLHTVCGAMLGFGHR